MLESSSEIRVRGLVPFQTGVFFPNARELGSCILVDLLLDILDVGLVEFRWLPILEDHVGDVFLV